MRFTVVQRLAESDATVGDLAAMFDITVQGVSQHLDVLEKAGLVSRHKEGRTRRVRLEPTALSEAAGWMEARRRRLEERYSRLDEVLTEMSRKGTHDDELRHEKP